MPRWQRPTLVAVAVLVITACGATVDNGQLASAVRDHAAAEVTVQGTVSSLLPDSNGSDGTHQRFDVDFSIGTIVEIDHNVTLAPRVPLHVGDVLIVHGQFEPDPGHPVIHYTHHATGQHEGGWIELGGQRYQ